MDERSGERSGLGSCRRRRGVLDARLGVAFGDDPRVVAVNAVVTRGGGGGAGYVEPMFTVSWEGGRVERRVGKREVFFLEKEF